MRVESCFIICLFLLLVGTASVFAGGKGEINKFRKTIRGLSSIDTNYIEPQHYNFTVMLQATYNYDLYQIRSNNGHEMTFSPDVKMRIGPYLGWRWFFLGYTFDLKNISFSGDKQKRELDFSIYSSKLGIDLFYRRTGSDYKIRKVNLGENVDASRLEDVPFDGISVGITGANLYYIFNHRRFSYPAAFSQSTCQKLSCGSWMAGVGFTHNDMKLDYDKLQDVVSSRCEPNDVKIDSGLMFNSVKYYNVNVSVGYAYNYVFAKNWLLCAGGAMAIAYKHSDGDTKDGVNNGFDFNNINIDGIGRFGLVYNNTRFYAGSSLIIRTNNYHKSRFSSNEVFGNLNIYVGYNFGKKSHYKRKEKKRK
ncbi:MAG: DUF4421 domain-containing protein [Prevotella sp.]|nr:DUF4421 domain-containing protein [Prevotella sp.]